ncbi:helix-turn-helix domain-containing protein [Pontimicrobium sp. MEBiC06410]
MKYSDEKEVFKQFGQRIKFLRKEYKLSQSALGGKADVEKSTIQRIEKGANVTMRIMVQLANAFDMSLSELLKIDELQNLKD